MTGRAAGSEMRKAEASYAITTIDQQSLKLAPPISTADTFRRVPGFWVESSGGEGSNNVRSRGIPTDGYSSVGLQENSLPVQYDGALGYLNADQSFRVDDTIARVEAVRGGPASIFSPNSPGGVVNFITRRGTDTPGGAGSVRYTFTDTTAHRVDAWFGKEIAPNLGLLVGGFYREGDGMRDMGFTAEKGGQIRATLNYDDGDNSVLLDVRHLDDRTPFYLPVPLTFNSDGGIIAVPGFDPLRDTLAGSNNQRVAIKNVGGPFDFDLTEGSHTQLTAVTLEAKVRMAEGVHFETRNRYRTSDILRNALFPTGNVDTIANYRTSLLAQARAGGLTGATGIQLRYADDGSAVPADANGNGLLVQGNFLSASVPLDEIISDNRITATVGNHALAAGVTYAHSDFRFDRYMGTALLDVRGNSRRVDAVAVDAAGAVVGRVTDDGFLRYGSLFDNAGISTDNIAFYAGDEWQLTPEIRIDFAGRYEKLSFRGLVANKRTVNLGDPTTIADNNVTTFGDGYVRVNQRYDGFGWTVGGNWQFEPNMGMFARYTDTFRLPSAGEWSGNPTRTDQGKVPIKMGEVGFKYGASAVSLFATAFWTKFERLTLTDWYFDNATSTYLSRVAIAGSETFGVEAEARVRPVGWFDLGLALTWQDPNYKNFTYTDATGNPVDFSGRQLIRVPKLAVRLTPGINLFDDRLRGEVEVEHYTKRFADIANSQPLPAFTNVNLNLRAVVTENVAAGLNVSNLFDTLQLTEGNPRAGSFVSGDAGAQYFLARPNFGRIIRASATVSF
ncbi:TonB-dependent receptor [Polymorphobacter fuscus]|uniref:TonB-dependent receptor n=1 Tax=Sandarakinorhabdus fusca TaxID=1439888 RepID=UPI0014320C9A|nr:TonB-dependent receptor [Polymorphobacter fuscus]NJC09320.1 outer membrane receptor protein involved in Fe transport [Polymorphobacter fuscus]